MSTLTIQHELITASSKLESDELMEKGNSDTLDIDASGEPDESIQSTVKTEENNSGSSSISIEENASASGGSAISSRTDDDNLFSSMQYTRLRNIPKRSRPTTLKHRKSTPTPSRTVPDITRRHVTTSLPSNANHEVDARIMSAVGIGMILILTILIFVLYRKKKLQTTAAYDMEAAPGYTERDVSNATYLLHEIKRDGTQNDHPSKKKINSPSSDDKPEVLRKDVDTNDVNT